MNKVVLLTGAAGRLGAASAAALAARGASLALVDASSRVLEEVAAGLPATTPVVRLAVDLTAEGAPEAAVSLALESFGRLDALVNGAGVEGPIARAEEVELDDVRRVFEINVFALLRLSGLAVRHFRTQGSGRIVNLASGAGLGGTGLMAAYSASKHAVVGLTRSMAKEAAVDGIAINAVCPGCVDSPMMERIESRLGELAGRPVSFLDAVPMGRYCNPAEVGELVAYLALEAPAYMTGAALVIDGGLRA